MSEWTPLGDRVIVRPIEEKVSEIITQVSKPVPVKGTVVAVGDEAKRVVVGDVVLFKQYAATEYEELLIFKECDLLAVKR